MSTMSGLVPHVRTSLLEFAASLTHGRVWSGASRQGHPIATPLHRMPNLAVQASGDLPDTALIANADLRGELAYTQLCALPVQALAVQAGGARWLLAGPYEY